MCFQKVKTGILQIDLHNKPGNIERKEILDDVRTALSEAKPKLKSHHVVFVFAHNGKNHENHDLANDKAPMKPGRCSLYCRILYGFLKLSDTNLIVDPNFSLYIFGPIFAHSFKFQLLIIVSLEIKAAIQNCAQHCVYSSKVIKVSKSYQGQ